MKKKPKRNYRREYDMYHGKPKQIKERTARGRARRICRQIFGNKISGKDIDHIDHNPLNNALSNLRITSKHYNRKHNWD